MFDPLALKRPAEKVETRTLTDPSQPDLELTLTLSASRDYTLKLKAQTMAAEFERTQVGGDKVPITVEGEDGNRVAIEITPELCAIIASIKCLVRTPEVAEWDFDRWAALAVVMPVAFEQLVNWASDLIDGRVRATGDSGPPVPNASAEASAAT